MDPSILPFLHPRGIAVIGASTAPDKLGHGIARNLLASGFTGAIHFVSQKPGQLFGRPVYTEVSQVPDPVDLAVIIVPPGATPGVLDACGARGIKAAIIASSGFREAGPEGAELEAECLDTARAHGMRLLGPNCIGTIDTHLRLDTTFLQPPMPVPGQIGFISHSGAFCATTIDWARGEGFGFSQVVSLGNQVDVNETDMISALAEDKNTAVIVLYMESVSDGRHFVETAQTVSRRKPIVALKVGRSHSGRKAALSHTGALAGSEAAFDAAFERAGVLRAASAEQLFDWARALADCPSPRGKRVAILTDAGGPGVIAADAIDRDGLSLARLADSTVHALSATLPAAASLHNPVDMLASASPETYAACLRLLLADPNVDACLVILPPPPMFAAEAVARVLIPEIKSSEKPVVMALMGSQLTAGASKLFSHALVPAYPFPERAVSALAALSRRAEYLSSPAQSTEKPAPTESRPPAAWGSAEELCSTYGIQIAPTLLARGPEQAAAIATQLGFPVVMKIASPDITHKSDVGGVLLDINTPEESMDAYAQLIDRAFAQRPEASLEGVLLQRRVEPGQDVIVGAVRDPQFGPLVMFGSGGIEAEGLGDVAFALAPLSPAEAELLIARTWAGRKLRGFRSIPPADIEAVKDVVVRLSWLVMEQPAIEEIEINPLRALARSAVALDVRMKCRSIPETML